MKSLINYCLTAFTLINLITGGLNAQTRINLELNMPGHLLMGKLQGYNTAGMFTLSTYNYIADATHPLTANYSYQKMLETKPTVLRFPQGGDVKFAKLLGSDPDEFTSIPPYNNVYGYGYEIGDVIEFYMQYYNWPTSDQDCNGQPGYESAVTQWEDNEIFNQNERQHEPYIIQFKRLVTRLQIDLNYTIDIIYTMNIHTADVQYNIDVLNYLMQKSDLNSDGDTDDWEESVSGLNIVGVELGNEEYGCEFDKDFDQYFDHVLPFIEELRATFGNSLKIGIIGAPPGSLYTINGDPDVVGSCHYMQANTENGPSFNTWNQILFGKEIDDEDAIIIGSEIFNTWDAVVVHPYVDEDLFNISTNQCQLFSSTGNLVSSPDLESLFETYNKDLIGYFNPYYNDECEDFPWTGYAGLPGTMDYYADYIYNRQYEDGGYVTHPEYEDDADVKLWFTEWNLNPKQAGNPCDEGIHTKCSDNTMFHGIFIQRCLQELYRINSNTVNVSHGGIPEERIYGLLEYATLHNFSNSSTQTNLICHKKELDNDIIHLPGGDMPYHGTDWLEDEQKGNKYTPINNRINFYPFSFSSPISSKSLTEHMEILDEVILTDEVGSPLLDSYGNPRIYFHPIATKYAVSPKRDVYLFFENPTDEGFFLYFDQDVTFNCTTGPPFSSCEWVLNDIEPNLAVKRLKADSPWQTSGASDLYTYSSHYYDDINPDPVIKECAVIAGNEPPFQIPTSIGYYPLEGVTPFKNRIQILPYSFGCIIATMKKINYLKEGEVNPIDIVIYPNPYKDLITFGLNFELNSQSDYSIEIYSILGEMIDEILHIQTNQISYSSEISSGTYFYKLLENATVIATGNFVKQ